MHNAIPDYPRTTPKKAIKYTLQALKTPAMGYNPPMSLCKALVMVKATTYITTQYNAL